MRLPNIIYIMKVNNTTFQNIKLPEGIRAALIDMDGVLYDSMPYHAQAWHTMLSERGINTDLDEFFLYEGMTGEATIDLIFMRELGRHATEEEKKELYRRKSDLFVKFGKKEMMPGAAEMLRELKQLSLDTILVTGSAQSSLLNSLDTDYPGCFPAGKRVTALDVKKGKPDPEPYLKALEKARVRADEAIVIENAPLGVRAGKSAGCFTIAVTTGPIAREEFEKEGADLIFPSMQQFAIWLKYFRSIRDLCGKIDKTLEQLNAESYLVVTDSNVSDKVMPLLKDAKSIANSPQVILEAGEDHKNLSSVEKIWLALEETGATRKSVIVNIGGGMVSDIGGFAAATFKRGIRYMNIPTTLLAAVDAATGGKTGVNYNGLKNEIGAFHAPAHVIISSLPYSSLPHMEVLSGYAEMVKTALIADESLYLHLSNMGKVISDKDLLEGYVKRCVKIKEDIVNLDPFDKGIRKTLNFGHTAGHAFESLMLKRATPVPHGIAVAHGILVALLLSVIIKNLPSSEVTRYVECILKPEYPRLNISCDDLPSLMEYMARDKKNSSMGSPAFTLLSRIGTPEIDCHPSDESIGEALDLYRDIME